MNPIWLQNSKNMKNILIINAHQRYPSSEGTLNNSLVQIAKDFFENEQFNVELTHIESGYEIQEEADKHENADLVITQLPIFWFGGPWIYKKYIDEVFSELIRRRNLAIGDGRQSSHDNPYGSGGTGHGKKFLLSSTWNAPKQAFDQDDAFLFEGLSLDEVLTAISTPYKFMGFEIIEGFACFDVKKRPEIASDFKRFKEKLISITHGK